MGDHTISQAAFLPAREGRKATYFVGLVEHHFPPRARGLRAWEVRVAVKPAPASPRAGTVASDEIRRMSADACLPARED